MRFNRHILAINDILDLISWKRGACITRYHTYKSYLSRRYEKPAYRVGIDAGFSCPNRGADRRGGCSYCDQLGSTAVYQRKTESALAAAGEFLSSIDDMIDSEVDPYSLESRKQAISHQIEKGIGFLRRRYHAQLFMLYFQAYSNTYGPVPELKELYDYALCQAEFSELIIATRPDCIDAERVALIASYRDQLEDVWVELGLQSANDRSLRNLRRGHTVDQFCEAFSLLRSSGIKISVHVILGLPGEGYDDIYRTAELLTRLHPEAVKIHNLHIPAGTVMYNQYRSGEIQAPSTLRHLSYTMAFLERIPRDIIIQRLICDTPAHRLAAPLRFSGKGQFIGLLEQTMEARDTWQGRLIERSQHGS